MAVLNVSLEVGLPIAVGDRVTVLTGKYAGQGGTVLQHAEQIRLDSGASARYLHSSIAPVVQGPVADGT